MTILSPMPRKRGRIEIIPLIDIMFFLLAAFMMVSIHKVKVKSLKVSLPTDVPVSQLEAKEDFITLAIDAQGHVAIDKEMVPDTNALLDKMKTIYARNKDQKVLVAADRDSRNGDVIAVLGKLRIAGFQHVAFNLKSGTAKPSGGSAPMPPPPAPEPPAAPGAPEPTTPAAAAPTVPAAPTPPAATTPAETAPAAPTPPAAPAAPAAPPEAPAKP